MRFNFKSYQISKTKKYLKKNNFILLTYGANKNSSNWLITEQELYKLSFNYHKTYNNITIKLLEKTRFKNFFQIFKSTFFFFKTKQIKNQLLFYKNLLIKNLQNIQFYVHSLKLNNKIYSLSQLKNMNSFKYLISIKLFYQFLRTNLKTCYIFNK